LGVNAIGGFLDAQAEQLAGRARRGEIHGRTVQPRIEISDRIHIDIDPSARGAG
jgi:hypothetical protein